MRTNLEKVAGRPQPITDLDDDDIRFEAVVFMRDGTIQKFGYIKQAAWGDIMSFVTETGVLNILYSDMIGFRTRLL